jgi:hypothetical protein
MPRTLPPHLALRLVGLLIVVPWMVLAPLLVPNYQGAGWFIVAGCIFAAVAAHFWVQLPLATRRRAWTLGFGPRSLSSSMLITVSLSITLAALPSVFRGSWPLPAVHDEFAFLLGADTFLHGRLTNPSPPGWHHFESMHIIVTPTYQSKYQPGMSFALAAGLLLTGEPYVGMLLAMALASAAVTWMCHVWLPPRWRLAMACLASVMIVFTWSDHFMVGGPLAVAAGALQLGLLRRFGPASGLFHGIGWGISTTWFLWTRPFEGCVFTLLVGLGLLTLAFRQQLLGRLIGCVVPGALLVLVPVILFQASYNETITGSKTKLPYLVHEEQYSIVPVYLFQEVNPEPAFRHAIIRDFHRDMADWHNQQRTGRDWPMVVSFRFAQAWLNFGLLLWLVPVLTLPELWRRPPSRWLLLLWLVFLGILQTVCWFMPHYAAPGAAAWFLIVALGLRHLRLWGRNGRYLAAFSVISFIAYAVIVTCATTLASHNAWEVTRARLERQLSQSTEKYLLLIRYEPKHHPSKEWVYNGADIPSQRVIWARAMSPDADRELAKLYPEHRPFYVDADTPGEKSLSTLIPLK